MQKSSGSDQGKPRAGAGRAPGWRRVLRRAFGWGGWAALGAATLGAIAVATPIMFGDGSQPLVALLGVALSIPPVFAIGFALGALWGTARWAIRVMRRRGRAEHP